MALADGIAILLATLVSIGSPASAANPYCAASYFWHPDGTSTPGVPNWSSFGANSAFVAGPCLGVSGIGTTQTYKKTFLVIDRSAAKNGYMTLPGRPQDLAYAEELDVLTGRQRPLDVITNTFCSSGQHTPDGTFLSVGGDWSPDYAAPGEFSIRAFRPCTDGTCGFSIVDNLTHSRWYPTTALLGDGRVIVVGGSSRGVGLNSADSNVPFVEYYPKARGEAYELQFLRDTTPYNLYPFVHLLPSGRVFLFAGSAWTLYDTAANDAVPGMYPPITATDARGSPLRMNYPLIGTSALFPLTSANGYAAEVMVCGGGAEGAIRFDRDQKVLQDPDYPTSAQCFRIYPEAAAPEWVTEVPMRLPRVDAVAVLLPDGHLLVMGGTQTGFSGLGKLAHKPALTPEMYDTASHRWHSGPALATSRVPRSYHSEAVLLHNGVVLVSGSNPNSDIVGGGEDFPTEFRTEYFVPPYLARGLARPALVRAPDTVAYGAEFTVAFRHPNPGGRVQVVLAQPGFSTHGANHGMRNVVLDIKGVRVNGQMRVATVTVPLNPNLLPPTWYWLFVLVDGAPNREGHYVFVRGAVATGGPALSQGGTPAKATGSGVRATRAPSGGY